MHKTCPVCGIEFTDPKHPQKKYCSIQCCSIGRIKPENHRICEQCGKPFHHKDRLGNESPPRFCSRDCYDTFRTESRPLCAHCGKRVPGGNNSGEYKTRYCSQKCKVAHLKPKPRPCINCGTVFTPVKFHKRMNRFIGNNDGKTCSPRCENEWMRNNTERKRKIGIAFAGANHPNWQGGKSAISRVSYRGLSWRSIAEKVRKRDKHTCQKCGKT